LFATAINFFKKCLLNAYTMPIVWKNKHFLPNNCLTRIQTFHRLFEANCLYNRMEKNSCFAEQLLISQLTLSSWYAVDLFLVETFKDLLEVNDCAKKKSYHCFKMICSDALIWLFVRKSAFSATQSLVDSGKFTDFDSFR
jgi:hypothetical protein